MSNLSIPSGSISPEPLDRTQGQKAGISSEHKLKQISSSYLEGTYAASTVDSRVEIEKGDLSIPREALSNQETASVALPAMYKKSKKDKEENNPSLAVMVAASLLQKP